MAQILEASSTGFVFAVAWAMLQNPILHGGKPRFAPRHLLPSLIIGLGFGIMIADGIPSDQRVWCLAIIAGGIAVWVALDRRHNKLHPRTDNLEES